MSIRVRTLLPLLGGALAVVPATAQRATTPLALDSITPARIEAHLRFLSSDLLEGRAPGTRGGELAARYIATQFALAGLEPGAPDGTWFQPVPILESIVEPSFTLAARSAAGETKYEYGRQVVAWSGLSQPVVEIEAPLVFVGYGIVAPEYGWNDYAGLDMKGKIALVMVNDPPAPADEPELFGGPALTYYGRWTYKFEEAARQGAAGALLIHTTESATYGWQVVQSSWTGKQYSIPTPEGTPTLALKGWVTEEVARELAKAGGADLDALRKAASVRGARPVALEVKVGGTIRQTVEHRESPNVIGLVRGQNPREAVVYTFHYDHLGMRDVKAGEDGIYNGARDNASGVAGVLEIARVVAASPEPPARTLMFVATTAEESGLLGAEYFAAHPPIPLDRIAANLNIDSLNVFGPARDIVLLGADRSTLGEAVSALAAARGRTVGRDAHPERGYFFRSDHFPLAKGGVPALSLSGSSEYTGPRAKEARALRHEYDEKHYHQPSDEFDPRWNFEGAAEDVRFMAALGWQIAASPEMPAYEPGDQFARPRQGSR